MDETNINRILKDYSESGQVDETYRALNTRYDNIYHFVMNYSDYIYASHPYGGAEPMSMIEVHTLSYIEDHPGVTPTELVKFWNKTKGAISQILARLTDRGLIEKRKLPDNAKTLHLFVTEEGARISQAHKRFDIQDITRTVLALEEHLTVQELETFYKVLAVYNQVIRDDFANQAERKG